MCDPNAIVILVYTGVLISVIFMIIVYFLERRKYELGMNEIKRKIEEIRRPIEQKSISRVAITGDEEPLISFVFDREEVHDK